LLSIDDIELSPGYYLYNNQIYGGKIIYTIEEFLLLLVNDKNSLLNNLGTHCQQIFLVDPVSGSSKILGHFIRPNGEDTTTFMKNILKQTLNKFNSAPYNFNIVGDITDGDLTKWNIYEDLKKFNMDNFGLDYYHFCDNSHIFKCIYNLLILSANRNVLFNRTLIFDMIKISMGTIVQHMQDDKNLEKLILDQDVAPSDIQNIKSALNITRKEVTDYLKSSKIPELQKIGEYLSLIRLLYDTLMCLDIDDDKNENKIFDKLNNDENEDLLFELFDEDKEDLDYELPSKKKKEEKLFMSLEQKIENLNLIKNYFNQINQSSVLGINKPSYITFSNNVI
jgi:hypothetical protein